MGKDSISVLIVDEEGAIGAFNRSARRMFGCRVGDQCHQLVPGPDGKAQLPCSKDCARRLLEAGMDSAVEARCTKVGGASSSPACPWAIALCAPSNTARRTPTAADKPLTARELTVLQLLADGATTADCAQALGLSAATVRTHVEKLRAKLGANTRAAIVARGFQLGHLN